MNQSNSDNIWFQILVLVFMESETGNFPSSSTLTCAQLSGKYCNFNLKDSLHLKHCPYVKMLDSVYECTLDIDDSFWSNNFDEILHSTSDKWLLLSQKGKSLHHHHKVHTQSLSHNTTATERDIQNASLRLTTSARTIVYAHLN